MNDAAAIVGQRRALRALSLIVGALVMTAFAGCATTGPNGQPPNPKDPYESFNRGMFAFNDKLDTYALKPVAEAYEKVLPSPIRTGVHNFFGNISDVWSTANQLLQGKFDNTARMTMRVMSNTIIGLGGLLDPATEMGLERQSEDLGQTLGYWGVPPGPYLVLPLFGPSDVRDAVALPGDQYVGVPLLLTAANDRPGAAVLGVIDARANLLSASQIMDEIALDRYTFLRDAYITRRRSLVYDGNPPEEPDTSDDEPQGAPNPGAPASAPAPAVAPSAPAPANAPSAPAPASAATSIEEAAQAPVPPSAPSAPTPGGVTPAPLPASAPPLPVPLPGPAPVPPPPASAPH